MRAADVLDQASITDVWAALGGDDLRHGRGRAWWRDGDGYSIALDDTKGCWFDHARGTGGGMLSLIETVLGCERRVAIKWLADHQNVCLDDHRPLTHDEKRRYAQRRGHAESKAQNLTDWRRNTLRRLRGDRNPLYESEDMACAVARVLLATGDGSGDENAWNDIWKHAHDDLRADAIDHKIRRLETATPGQLVAMRQESSEAA